MVNSRMSLDDLNSVTTVLDHLDIGVTILMATENSFSSTGAACT